MKKINLPKTTIPTLSTIILLLVYGFFIKHILIKTKENLAQSLQTVLNTTKQAMDSWATGEKQVTQYWSTQKEIQNFAVELLEIEKMNSKNNKSLKYKLVESNAQKKTRELMLPFIKSKGHNGYFIISPSFVNLASSRDTNIGEINPLKYKKKLIKKVLKGETVFSHPMKNDLSESNAKDRTMFTLAPIKNDSGEVIAIFTLRIHPDSDYTMLLERGRMGETGETYSFDENGLMLSRTRFIDQLRDIGLIDEKSKTTISTISIRDPGKKLGKNTRSQLVDQTNMKPTLMVQNAILKKSGINLEGYRDYRGVKVIGAWTWENPLNIGITTEIDHAEAYDIFYTTLVGSTIFCLISIIVIWIINMVLNSRQKIENEIREVEISNEMKSKFLATMSHEIRTPMNGIIGMLGIIRETNLTVEQKEILNTIKISSDKLLSILNDILDFSKIHSGKMTFEMITFNTYDILKNSINLFKTEAMKKKIILSQEVDSNLPSYLKGDYVRIQQIINNLISNALKFTTRGSVKVKFLCKTKNKNKCDLIIEVIDTGCGIPEEKVKNLFTPFTQADESINRKYGGTGLGLAIINELVHLMKGEVKVVSELGTGTTFTVCLPLDISPEDHMMKQPDEKVVYDINFGRNIKHKILVVEDNEINQILLKKMLFKLGLTCDIANNGKEALQIIKDTKIPYTLIFMDLQMPEIDGFETTRRILAMFNENAPQIVALTANAFVSDINKCKEVGLSAFISKPIDVNKLKEVLAA